MSATHHDVLDEAVAIVDGEFRRLERRHTLGCAAITLLLLAAASLMVIGVSLRSPIPYAGGIAAFAVALVVARDTPDQVGPRDVPGRGR